MMLPAHANTHYVQCKHCGAHMPLFNTAHEYFAESKFASAEFTMLCHACKKRAWGYVIGDVKEQKCTKNDGGRLRAKGSKNSRARDSDDFSTPLYWE